MDPIDFTPVSGFDLPRFAGIPTAWLGASLLFELLCIMVASTDADPVIGRV